MVAVADRGGHSEGREPRSDATRNRDQLTRAAVAAFHREGLAVPMTTIAAEAGVGVGTLYRNFATREDLLEELTHRSFARLVAHLEHAESTYADPTEVLRAFLAAVVEDRHDLLLPSTGGPTPRGDHSRGEQARLHDAIRRVLARGREDGSIRRDVDVWDVAWLGATLAQPGRDDPGWESICLRLLDTYLAGLSVPR